MADFYGVNMTKALAPSGANILAPGIWGGRVRAQVDSIESATGHKNKTIQFGVVPKGATFLGIIVNCQSGWGASVTGTFKLGDTTISSALDLNTGTTGIMVGLIGAEVVTQVTSDTAVTMTVSDNTVTADKYIQVVTLYTTD